MSPNELAKPLRFRASKMPRVMVCAGSYLLNAPREDESGDEADEGNVAHAHAFKCITTGAPLSDIPDLEMMRAVSLYVDTCGKNTSVDSLARAEDPHEIDVMGHVVPGTCDFFSWSTDGTLTIIDLKYGHGWVGVRENWQLITYAVLMWLKYGNGQEPNTVRLVVVQPRANHPAGPIREWSFDGVLLRNYRNQIQNQITAASHPGAPTRTGKECRYCPSLLDCHTNRAAVADAIDFAGTASASDLSGTALAHELETVKRAADLISHRFTALESYALERVKTGAIVPGYRAAQTYGALQWDVKDPIAAGRDIKKDLARPAAPITPTQAVTGKLLTKQEVELMASRRLGSFKLQKEDLKFAKELVSDAAKQREVTA